MEKIENSNLFNLSEFFATLINDIICRVALGRKYRVGEDRKNFKSLLDELWGYQVALMLRIIYQVLWINKIGGLDAKVEKVAKEFDQFLEVVEEHIKMLNKRVNDDDCRKDFVDVLLEIRKDGLVGFLLCRVIIKALILVIMKPYC